MLGQSSTYCFIDIKFVPKIASKLHTGVNKGKGAFSHTKNRSQIEICHKFEEGNGVIICERFRDKSIKN